MWKDGMKKNGYLAGWSCVLLFAITIESFAELRDEIQDRKYFFKAANMHVTYSVFVPSSYDKSK